MEIFADAEQIRFITYDKNACPCPSCLLSYFINFSLQSGDWISTQKSTAIKRTRDKKTGTGAGRGAAQMQRDKKVIC